MLRRPSFFLIAVCMASITVVTACKGQIDDTEESDNAELSSLIVSAGTLDPVFSPKVTAYSVSVGNDVESIAVTGTAHDKGATVGENNGKARSLSVGANEISIVVIAADEKTTKTYVVSVTRAVAGEQPPVRPADSNAALSSLTVSAGVLNPVFSPGITEYTVDVPVDTKTITVKGVAEGANAVVGGANGAETELKGGENDISIIVTAADSVTQKTYIISVYRAKDSDDSSNADLTGISLDVGTLKPAFSPAVTEYSALVGYSTSKVTVRGTRSNGSATVGGDHGVSKDLALGVNALVISVLAPDGKTSRTYTINVTRSDDSNAPDVTEFTILETTIDSSVAPQTVHGTLIVEDATGIYAVQLTFTAPDGAYARPLLKKRDAESTLVKEVYDWALTVNKGSFGGTWKAGIMCKDTWGYTLSSGLADFRNTFIDTAP